MMISIVILLVMNCYFTWQIAVTPKQLEQFNDLFILHTEELSEMLEEINNNLSNILRQLEG